MNEPEMPKALPPAEGPVPFTEVLDFLMRGWDRAAQVQRWNELTDELFTVERAEARVFPNQHAVTMARGLWKFGESREKNKLHCEQVEARMKAAQSAFLQPPTILTLSAGESASEAAPSPHAGLSIHAPEPVVVQSPIPPGIRFMDLLSEVMPGEELAAQVRRWNEVTREMLTEETAKALHFKSLFDASFARKTWEMGLGRIEIEKQSREILERCAKARKQNDEAYAENTARVLNPVSHKVEVVNFRRWLAGRRAFKARAEKCDWKGIVNEIEKRAGLAFDLPITAEFVITKGQAETLAGLFPALNEKRVSPTVKQARKVAGKVGSKKSPMSKRPDEVEILKDRKKI